MQLIFVVSLNFGGYAAKQGASQAMLWCFAVALFYVPLSAVVIRLSRAIPLEGGVYQWVKLGISPFAGYMAAWSFSVYCIFFSASYGSQLAAGFAYAGGRKLAWLGTSAWFSLLVLVALCGLAYVLNVRGLGAVKWCSGTGAVITVVIFVCMLVLLARRFRIDARAASAPFTLAMPALTLASVNVFTKMALFALSGLDQCGVFLEECLRPKNDVAKSVLVASPLIAVMYIVTTGGILAYIQPERVDLAAPVAQALRYGFGRSTLEAAIVGLTILGFNVMLIATGILLVGMVARLPMVAGWDGILPAWWSELHPRFRTPAKGIAVVATGLAVAGALSLLGVGNQEAVQVLLGTAYGCYCIMYLFLFGAVLFGFRTGRTNPAVGLRLTALTAFCVVIVCLLFQVVPISEVPDVRTFAVKVLAGILVANGLGAFVYWRRRHRDPHSPVVRSDYFLTR
jgi:amino acid transporter